MTRLEAAQELADRGFHLMPLQPKAKVPHFKLLPIVDGKPKWTPYTQEPASLDEIQAWFKHDPQINYGVITGANGLVVVDIDKPKALGKTQITPTISVRTGRQGGTHYYYQTDGAISGQDYPWGEVKGAGGYVVGPLSVHESGKVYEYIDFLSPRDMTFSPPPDWILDGKGSTSTDSSKDKRRILNYSLVGEIIPKTICTTPTNFEERHILNQSPEVAIRVMALCGVVVPGMGKAFCCPIPGHADRSPSAALYQEPDKSIILHDFHAAEDGRRFWPLVDVYASCKSGKSLELAAGERTVWWTRALYELGYIELPTIPYMPLPHNASADARLAYEGFILLLRLSQLYEPSPMTPFNRRFAAKWCATDVDTIRRGMTWLLRRNYLYIMEKGFPNSHPEGPKLTKFAIGTPR